MPARRLPSLVPAATISLSNLPAARRSRELWLYLRTTFGRFEQRHARTLTPESPASAHDNSAHGGAAYRAATSCPTLHGTSSPGSRSASPSSRMTHGVIHSQVTRGIEHALTQSQVTRGIEHALTEGVSTTMDTARVMRSAPPALEANIRTAGPRARLGLPLGRAAGRASLRLSFNSWCGRRTP